MSPKNRQSLSDRVARAAETSLAIQEYVAPLDVLMGIGWLDASTEKRWRLGQIESLEQALQVNPARISEAIELFHSWVNKKGLQASGAEYVARTPQRQTLRFSRSGDAASESSYRTHWIPPELSERKKKRLKETASRAPELVVIQPLNKEWACHRCGGSGDLLMMEPPGPVCLRCAGLADLEFLPAGDALLTRRAKAKSARSAVVVRFSRARGRYERRGLLVEGHALAEAQHEVAER
jgi:hypothetical protein